MFFSDSLKPIYLQIAEWLETEILAGNFAVDEKVYSQYQLAQMYNINPATAARGLNILAEEGILYKKRGLGMFVAPGAMELVRKRRRQDTLRQLVVELVGEADRLGVTDAELAGLIAAIRREKEEGQE
ncbi:MAG TPA: GntR family transcriptional regulator [Firmicutes bacterium]|nr:GntR family transcriptional regulator [Bacillota bacterium]